MSPETPPERPDQGKPLQKPKIGSRREFLKFGAATVAGILAGRALESPGKAEAHGPEIDPREYSETLRGSQAPRPLAQESSFVAQQRREVAQVTEFPTQTIDGLLTYGGQDALTSSQLAVLTTKINLAAGSRESLQANRTLALTIFCKETDYRQFKPDNGEDYQTFINRHMAVLNEMLAATNPPVNINASIARIVVVEDNVNCPVSTDTRYAKNPINDSDGVYLLPGYEEALKGQYVNGHWVPSILRPGSTVLRDGKVISLATLHGLGHALLHLRDSYYQDYWPSDDRTTPAFNDVPLEWQSYTGSRIGINERSIMGAGMDTNIPPYLAWQLNSRKDIHNLFEVIPETVALPRNAMLERMKINFKDTSGNTIVPDRMEIWNTTPMPSADGRAKKTLVKKYDGKPPDIYEPAKMFDKKQVGDLSGMVEVSSATQLYKLYKDNQLYLVWLPADYFNMASWQKKNMMTLTVAAAATQHQFELSGRVEYGTDRTLSLFRTVLPDIPKDPVAPLRPAA